MSVGLKETRSSGDEYMMNREKGCFLLCRPPTSQPMMFLSSVKKITALKMIKSGCFFGDIYPFAIDPDDFLVLNDDYIPRSR